MSKEITNEELLGAISGGFSAVENRFQDIEGHIGDVKKDIKRLESKIDGVSNRLDTEILRRTDEHADHEKRITALEVETGLAEPASS